jgi:hypothetical protein
LLLVVLAGCATFRAMFPPDRPDFIPASAAHVSGAHARAIAVAYDDWMKELARNKEIALADAGEEGDGGGITMPDEMRVPLVECYSRPDAYQTWVYPGDAGTSYIVVVLPFDEYCSGKNSQWASYGGGVIYEIDATTFEILKKGLQE